MDYTIRKSVRAKRMRLSMDSSGALTLVLPKFMPELAGRVFVQSQKKWIERQRSKVELKVENYLQQEIVTGSSIFIFDQKYYSIKIEPTNLIRDSFKVDSEYLVLKLSTKNKKSKQLRIKVLIEKFYRQKAKDYLTEASFFWAQKLGASFNDVRIKSTKTRWGSISTRIRAVIGEILK